MTGRALANRYARALADVIIIRNESDKVTSELSAFARMMRDHDELKEVFASPALPVEKKTAVLKELIDVMKLSETSSNFLHLLLNNFRLVDLDIMLSALAEEMDIRLGVVAADVTTARDITDDEKNKLAEKLKKVTGKDVRLKFSKDPEIIGGVLTRIGSVVYDGSIKEQLAQLKKNLLSV